MSSMLPKNERKARANMMLRCQTITMISDIRDVVTNITVTTARPDTDRKIGKSEFYELQGFNHSLPGK